MAVEVKRLRLRPIFHEVATTQVQDKYSTYPSNGLTPERLAAIFREADGGDVFRQMELFEEMEEKDPHLFSQLQTRKNAVTGLDYEIIPFSTDQPRDKEIAEFVRDAISALENLEDVMMDLLDSIGKGFAIAEIIWDLVAGIVVVKDIKRCPQKNFFWDHKDDLLVRTPQHTAGIPLPVGKFILHRYKARSGHPSRAGVLRVVAWMYLFKNYDLKDWVSFCEVFGMPLRLGKYAQGASESDKASLRSALIHLGVDAAGIIPEGTDIQFVTAEKAAATDLYERLARYCDEQMSKAILGQTLTSDSGNGGSYAQSKTHNEVRHDLTVADCKALAATLRRDLIRPLVVLNFGESQRIPYLRFDCEEAGDLEQLSTILAVLVEKTGLKIPTSYIYKKFGIPRPEDGEDVASPNAPAMPAWSGSPVAHKADIPINRQARVDALASAAISASASGFEAVFSPVLELVAGAASMDELKEAFTDPVQMATLLRQMDASQAEVLLQKTMLYANLDGRALEDG